MVEKIVGSAEMITKNGKIAPEVAFAGKKAVAFYFSAHWCPPCRFFTPRLGEAFNQAACDELAVVFVSCDNGEEEFSEYFGSMPANWLAIPPTDERADMLSAKFDVSGIPRLVVLNAETGAVINNNARGDVESKGAEAILNFVAQAK